jgi:hypothetical protein
LKGIGVGMPAKVASIIGVEKNRTEGLVSSLGRTSPSALLEYLKEAQQRYIEGAIYRWVCPRPKVELRQRPHRHIPGRESGTAHQDVLTPMPKRTASEKLSENL